MVAQTEVTPQIPGGNQPGEPKEEKSSKKRKVLIIIVCVVVLLAAAGVTTGVLVSQHNQQVAAEQAAARKAAQVEKAHAQVLKDCVDASDSLATAQSAFEKTVSDKATVAALKITAKQVSDGKTVTSLKTAAQFKVDSLEACDTKLSDTDLKSLTQEYDTETDSYTGKADAVVKAVKAVNDSKAAKDKADKAAADAKAKADAQAQAQQQAQSQSNSGSYSSGSSSSTPKNNTSTGKSGGTTSQGSTPRVVSYTLHCTITTTKGTVNLTSTWYPTASEPVPHEEFCHPVADAYMGLPNHGIGNITVDEIQAGLTGWTGRATPNFG
jgi:colicin import membrane protein